MKGLAEWTGLEPATSGVTGQHSNRLNYHSAFCPATPLILPQFDDRTEYLTTSCSTLYTPLVGAEGFEPPTLSV